MVANDKYPGVKRGMLRCCFVSTGEGELAKLQEANLAWLWDSWGTKFKEKRTRPCYSLEYQGTCKILVFQMALFVLRCIHIYHHVLEKIRAPVSVDHLGVHWQKCPEDGVHVQGWWGCARRWLRCTGWWWWWRWWCRRWCRFAWLAHWVQEGNRAPCYTGQRKHSGPHKGLTGMAALPRLSDSWKGDHEMSKTLSTFSKIYE